MKHLLKITSLVLCLCLCAGLLPAALAAEHDVTVTATLNQSTLKTSTTEHQTVELYISADKNISLAAIGGQITWDEPLVLQSIEGASQTINIQKKDVNLDNGAITWYTEDSEDVTAKELLKVTFLVPINTPAGNYTVGFDKLVLGADYGTTKLDNNAAATATLTVTGETNGDVVMPEKGYTTTLTASTVTPVQGEVFTVSLNAAHSSETSYAAMEATVLYDHEKLAYRADRSTLGTNTVVQEHTPGLLRIADYGDERALGNDLYQLAFEAKVAGASEVELTAAAFTNKTNAETKDLTPATVESAPLTPEVVFSVTLPSAFEGLSIAHVGQSYTFHIADATLYNYNITFTAVMGNETVPVVSNGNGSYTVENVTGHLTITYQATPKEFTVTYPDVAPHTSDGSVAVYGTDYHFTLPDNVAAGLQSGMNYTLESVKIGEKSVPHSTSDNRSYTIAGADITGDLTITIRGTVVDRNQFTVTTAGNAVSAIQPHETVVDKGEDYSLEAYHITGYLYTMTVTMGGEPVEVITTDNGNGIYTYTVAKVTGDLVFTLNKTVNLAGVNVYNYLTLGDGQYMWLVTQEITLSPGHVSTYDGQPMFWSEQYQAYCYLVIAADLTLPDAQQMVGGMEGTALTVANDKDVNGTGIVDAADAQLAYNMYRLDYQDFSDTVPMIKFLRADVNNDQTIDTSDAVTIINQALLKK